MVSVTRRWSAVRAESRMLQKESRMLQASVHGLTNVVLQHVVLLAQRSGRPAATRHGRRTLRGAARSQSKAWACCLFGLLVSCAAAKVQLVC